MEVAVILLERCHYPPILWVQLAHLASCHDHRKTVRRLESLQLLSYDALLSVHWWYPCSPCKLWPPAACGLPPPPAPWCGWAPGWGQRWWWWWLVSPGWCELVWMVRSSSPQHYQTLLNISTVQYSTVHYSAAQYSTVHYSTVQYSIPQRYQTLLNISTVQ